MASKTKKAKQPKIPIGDQIMLEVGRWHIDMGKSCTLEEFKVGNETRIGALVSYGYLKKTEHGTYRLTETGRAYVLKQFPERFAAARMEQS